MAWTREGTIERLRTLLEVATDPTEKSRIPNSWWASFGRECAESLRRLLDAIALPPPPPSDAGERDRALVREGWDTHIVTVERCHRLTDAECDPLIAAVNATHPPAAAKRDECRVSHSRRCGFVQEWHDAHTAACKELDRITAIIGDVIDVCEPDPADEDEPRDALAVAKRCAAALAQMTAERDALLADWKEIDLLPAVHAAFEEGMKLSDAVAAALADVHYAEGTPLFDAEIARREAETERDEWKKRAEEACAVPTLRATLESMHDDALRRTTAALIEVSEQRDEARRERDAATAAEREREREERSV